MDNEEMIKIIGAARRAFTLCYRDVRQHLNREQRFLIVKACNELINVEMALGSNGKPPTTLANWPDSKFEVWEAQK